ncbi:hypothetical protein C8Q76DRAFT_592296, partial [Earliella scabrosa]
LKTLQVLFNHKFVPNHHLSLHLWQCLLLFGPVHAWWAFPFERYNGLLQNLNTNSQAAKMPLTFMRYFYIGAGLRWLMKSTKWPDARPYKRMVAAYNEAILQMRSARGVRTRNVPILNDRVNYIRKLRRDGMTFATRKSAIRNSFILFEDPLEPSDELRAGQISEIFLHGRREGARVVVESFILVDEYRCLNTHDAEKDPYRRFPDLQTRLFYNDFLPTSRLIRLEDVRCHFAALICTPQGLDKQCMVARSLDRASK